MPLYDYECPDCLSRFEIKRSFDDNDPVYCPQCRSTAQRLFVPVPVIFKGSGFYVTDNRKGNGQSGEETSDTQSKPSSPETKESSAESKTTSTEDASSD